MHKMITLWLVLLGPLATLAQEKPSDKYHRLQWEADSAEVMFYIQFWQSYNDVEVGKIMDSKAFVVSFGNWMMKIIERNNYVLENYERIISEVSFTEGVHILRIIGPMEEENQRLADNLRELMYH